MRFTCGKSPSCAAAFQIVGDGVNPRGIGIEYGVIVEVERGHTLHVEGQIFPVADVVGGVCPVVAAPARARGGVLAIDHRVGGAGHAGFELRKGEPTIGIGGCGYDNGRAQTDPNRGYFRSGYRFGRIHSGRSGDAARGLGLQGGAN